MFLPFRRATLLIPSGPDHDPDRKHLFFILTNPTNNASEVLLVSMSTIHTSLPYDNSCILHQGDHPFIRHDSYIEYSKARIVTAENLIRGIDNGVLVRKETIDERIIQKICDGLLTSPRTTPRIIKFYSAQLGTD